ncbi:hypothetical protein DFJ58DRAFT_771163 [Suillus subalutaceus]|uniref:uncharacterized protein n=1 Tax=Suillus subalutaceus TaxID=48586 RepID=UPI001B86CDA4|nr:uncharacterized protein DFJ58DRAFT_771163 [Suillus subalutaceus]KAG1865464.1 hypothetical protein DFJ58DRAFT_771163 [Suillus subalutaceus]
MGVAGPSPIAELGRSSKFYLYFLEISIFSLAVSEIGIGIGSAASENPLWRGTMGSVFFLFVTLSIG